MSSARFLAGKSGLTSSTLGPVASSVTGVTSDSANGMLLRIIGLNTSGPGDAKPRV